ncbi:PP2C family protein-serine/threonine phosphatase [Yinghuangia soli]|uniref:Protein phosphatase 2C domain-containing protein n=1 Tax=Yinghuangia soli TaxID=2908204 RepID=A0AA41Q8B1_9ACTN|nr:protein phosphatase 2C domain-containing protein [Yinghuangia soli]MCF2532047.1 protein phosphatase 2C domain-containing protein [Yinghuangia soli]
MTDTNGCADCAGTVAPDGHCWDCGSPQPGFRARIEQDEGAATGVSDRGKRRGVNADAMALSRVGDWTVAVVCDGVSMSPRAERAAQVAAAVGAAALTGQLNAGAIPEEALHDSAVRAGAAVAKLAASADAAPACTYVAGIAGPQGIWTAWVGDSRAYWLPDAGPGMALTEDDSGRHGALSAWLGADAGPTEPHVRSYRPRVPGHLLLCTDGLTRYTAAPGELRTLAFGTEAARLAPARALVQHALDAGGEDNITAVVIPVGG